ncbi:MAG: nucleotidyltransferase family protein [Cyanobacteria bacterium P01_D01_bin.73]
MKNFSEVQRSLQEQKPYLQEHYRVKELGVFGSYVRGEQTEESDVDVLVEFSRVPSLLRFINLENYLSDRLGIKVDLVHKQGLKPRLGERILNEVIYL